MPWPSIVDSTRDKTARGHGNIRPQVPEKEWPIKNLRFVAMPARLNSINQNGINKNK